MQTLAIVRAARAKQTRKLQALLAARKKCGLLAIRKSENDRLYDARKGSIDTRRAL